MRRWKVWNWAPIQDTMRRYCWQLCSRETQFFLDRKTIQVGGLLSNVLVSEDRINPIFLDLRQMITKAFVWYLHLEYFHAHFGFLTTFMSRRYWVVGGQKKLVKSIIRDCVMCVRKKGKLCSQLMGRLPYNRVNPTPVFSRCAVDLTGPLMCKCVWRCMRV